MNKENKSSQPPYTITNGYDLQTPIHLQLSQPQNQTQPRPQHNEIPAKGIKLGYVLKLLTICIPIAYYIDSYAPKNERISKAYYFI